MAEAFQEDEAARTCDACGHVMAPQADPWTLEAAEEWTDRWGNRR
jgi:hypothetical protein